MQKKDLRIHMIKVHGAPKPHAVSDSKTCLQYHNGLPLKTEQNMSFYWLNVMYYLWYVLSSVHCVPNVSCPALSYVCMRQLNIVVRNCLCVRSAAIGPPAATACKCTSKPFTGKHMPLLNITIKKQRTETCFIYCLNWLLITSVCYSKARLLANATIMHACGEKMVNNGNESKLDKKETFLWCLYA